MIVPPIAPLIALQIATTNAQTAARNARTAAKSEEENARKQNLNCTSFCEPSEFGVCNIILPNTMYCNVL